jgi:hypothetical protein
MPSLSDIGNAVGGAASSVGGFVSDHRHAIIDVATTAGAAFVVGSLCVGTAGAGCVVAGLAGVATTGFAAHVGSDALIHDDHNLSLGGALAHSLTSTATGAACGWLAGGGCLPKLLGGSAEWSTVGVPYAYLLLIKMAMLNHYPEHSDC